jgi:hydrogenase-4 component E
MSLPSEVESMTPSSFSMIIDFASGGLLLAAVLVVWRRALRSIVTLLACQGVALAAIPIATGAYVGDTELLFIGVAVLALRAVMLPWLLRRALAAEPPAMRDATPLVNTAASLLTVAGVTIVAFAVTRPLTDLEYTTLTRAVPTAFAVMLIGLFVMVTRRHAVSQAAGFLLLDNGIAATAFLLTDGVPMIVELGVSLDVLFAVIVIGILTGRLRHLFGAADLDDLQELSD